MLWNQEVACGLVVALWICEGLGQRMQGRVLEEVGDGGGGRDTQAAGKVRGVLHAEGPAHGCTHFSSFQGKEVSLTPVGGCPLASLCKASSSVLWSLKLEPWGVLSSATSKCAAGSVEELKNDLH